MNNLRRYIRLLIVEATATKKNMFLDRPSKSRGYMSGEDKTWEGEDTNELIFKYFRSMGMIEESRFKQMLRKPRFTDLRGYLSGAPFLQADAEGDYDEYGLLTSEAQEVAQKYIQKYFDKRFGAKRIKLEVDVSSSTIHPTSSYNKAARGASYRYESGHIIKLTLANMGIETEEDFEKYEDTTMTLSMLGRADQKIYEVLIHELLHMQQFLRYSKGKPTNQKWKKFSKSYEDAGGASGMGTDYFVFDDNASEMETFALQIAIELQDAIGKKKALSALTGPKRDISYLKSISSSIRTFEEHGMDLTRPELSTLLDRAREYLKIIR